MVSNMPTFEVWGPSIIQLLTWAVDKFPQKPESKLAKISVETEEYRQQLIDLLEAIRFGKEGMLPVLERLERGDEIAPNDFEILLKFRQKEVDIRRYLADISSCYAENTRNVSREDREKLQLLSVLKFGIRKTIYNEIRTVITFKAPVDMDVLRKLIEQIEEFNAQIDILLAKLRAKQIASLT